MERGGDFSLSQRPALESPQLLEKGKRAVSLPHEDENKDPGIG